MNHIVTHILTPLAQKGVIDGLIDSIIFGAVDPVIDIHIERGQMDVKWRESGYEKTTRSAREDFQDRIDKEGAAAFDRPVPTGWDIFSGCTCNTCELARMQRGF